MKRLIGYSLVAASVAACAAPEPDPQADGAGVESGARVGVVDTTIAAHFEAPGLAQPLAEATVSTRLMGGVTDVLVHEGSTVAAGTLLVRVDVADVNARGAQATAGVVAAEAALREATAQAVRIRALHAEGAAPRAQLDAVEAGLARAQAAVEAARAQQSEVAATRAYGDIRAPFAGIVTRRFVDVGDFAAPGAPLVTIQDVSRLRVSATVPAPMGLAVKRGAQLRAVIEGVDVAATVEGAVPAAGATYTVNAIVGNANGRFPAGGAAVLRIPTGQRTRALLVPLRAITRDGDLDGVRVARGRGSELRFVRLGAPLGDRALVLSGLAPGDSVVLPPAGR